jgi:hypothetical protein
MPKMRKRTSAQTSGEDRRVIAIAALALAAAMVEPNRPDLADALRNAIAILIGPA